MPIFTHVSVGEWLRLTQKGRPNNLPLVIPAGSTLSGQLNADNSLPYVMMVALQFDGVLAGQLSYEFVAGIQRVSGYAIPAVIQDELLLSDKGQPIRYTIASAQATAAIVNIDYMSMESHVIDNELLPALNMVSLALGVPR
jgi:hypothetical protein